MNDLFLELTEKLISLLKDWTQGRLNEQEVHEAAEELMEKTGWQDYERSDPNSVAMEVLMQLDILNQQLITQEDAPVMMEILSLATSNPSSAWQTWEQYWSSIDLEKRKHELESNPYYS